MIHFDSHLWLLVYVLLQLLIYLFFGGRGNAVMRHTAKKGNAQEVEISMNVDDPMTNLPPRTSKSTAKFIIHRLVRMFRMLTVIAVVNIPLYMMLLFKDWIDQ